MAERPRLLFSAFNEYVLSHHDHGSWSLPGARQLELNDVDYWVGLAKTLERGKFDFFFFADVLAPYDRYQGSRDAAIRTGMQTPVNDPGELIPILAYATEHLGFVLTQNILQEHPYAFARKITTLDHLSRGRIAWNIVTSFLGGAGRNLGLGGLPSHEDRYARAEEFVEVAYRLWEASWEDDAVVRDIERGVYADPAKVHDIAFSGEYYDVLGPHISEPSPQRTPVLFNAAASDVGIAFAGRHAEVLFTSFERLSAAESIRKLRASAAASGRRAEDVKIFAGFGFVLGSTEAEARRKYEAYVANQHIESILVKHSAFWDDDLSRFDLGDSVQKLLESGEGSPTTRIVLGLAPDLSWSFERFLRWFANRQVVGTPEQIADEIEAWQDAGVDGLNITYTTLPETYEGFVDHVRPLLVERGIQQRDYGESPTVRGKVFGQPQLPDSHPARRSRDRVRGIPAISGGLR